MFEHISLFVNQLKGYGEGKIGSSPIFDKPLHVALEPVGPNQPPPSWRFEAPCCGVRPKARIGLCPSTQPFQYAFPDAGIPEAFE